MAYLYDTNVIIYYINGEDSARQLFLKHAPDGIAISTIAYMEVLDGIPASPNPTVAGQRFTTLMNHLPVIDFTRDEAEKCVQIRQNLRREGREWRRRAVDLMIAATAMEHNLVLVTNNPADYSDINGLNVEIAPLSR